MSIFNNGLLKNIKDYLGATKEDVFSSRTTIGYSDAVVTSGKYNTAVISVRGDWEGRLRLYTRFTAGDANNLGLITDVYGNSLDRITENGEYYLDITGQNRYYVRVQEIDSGSVSVTTQSTNNRSNNVKIQNNFSNGKVRTFTAVAGYIEDDSEVEIEENVNSVTVFNESQDTPISFMVNALWVSWELNKIDERITVQPGGSVTVNRDRITRLQIASYAGYAKVKIITGNNIPASINQPSRKYKIGYYGRQEALRGTDYIGYNLYHVRGNIFLMYNDTTQLHVSIDHGATVENSYTFSGAITKAYYLQSGTILVHADGGLWRSTDTGETFTEVIESCVNWYSMHGIDENEDVVIFAEYGSAESVKRIWRSDDDGATWDIEFSQDTPDDIRHFHTMQYLPLLGRWIATSGDDSGQSFWYWSSGASGTTWEKVPVTVAGGQIWRTLALINPDKDTLIWGTDSTTGIDGTTGVYSIKVSDLTAGVFADEMVNRILRVNTYIYPTHYINDTIVVGTQVFDKTINNHVPAIFASHDRGATWEKIIQVSQSKTANSSQRGFLVGVGVDGENRLYIPNIGISNRATDFDQVMGLTIQL